MSFNFQSNIKNIQNRLIAQSIRDTSNSQILKSEDAVKNLIKSYSDRFKSVEGMLFDVARYVAESKEIIRAKDLNDMFEVIFIDLYALYNDMDLVSQILSLNLQRNKSYFLIIKKRIKDLWNKLRFSRLSVYDNNPADESFYEAFNSHMNVNKIQNIVIDKKTGNMHLKPLHRRIHNKAHEIQSISSTTYPVESDTGGVNFTSSYLNSFDYNYGASGPRDMLQNGLWKEEVLCNDVPSIILDVGDSSLNLYKNFNGVVSVIDIEYTHAVELNRIDLDIFGEYPLKVDQIFYKSNPDSSWVVLRHEIDHAPNGEIVGTRYIGHRAFDVSSLFNLRRTRVYALRFVLNQENYVFLDSQSLEESKLNNRIESDLSERRYEVAKFGTSLNDFMSKPANDDNISLYSKIIEVIDATKSVENILDKIEDILIPSVDVKSYDFSRVAKFEIGAWSIEPKNERYTSLEGKFDSNPYEIRDRALLSVSLKSKQVTPLATTCNWYIGVGGKNIPIVPNDDFVAKEPIFPISMSSFSNFRDWTSGTFLSLDFPIDPAFTDRVGIYDSATDSPDYITSPIVWLNSRLLYINEINDPYRSDLVLKYHPARYQTVNVYTLTPSKDVASPIDLGVVSARKDLLTNFINEATYNGVLLSDLYTVNGGWALIEEAKKWFNENFSKGIFLEWSAFFSMSYGSMWDPVVNVGLSKSQAYLSDVEMYLADNILSESANLELLAQYANIAPINVRRDV